MNKDVLQQAAEFFKSRKRKKVWYRIVTCMAAVVVFCTTYALILPAITMEKEATCAIEEHVHDDNCYELPGSELTCSPDLHSHSGSCYDESGSLICGTADYFIHTHAESCYDEAQALVCALPEVTAHVHDSSCYRVEVYEQETEPVHQHTDACYEQSRGELTCQESTELHVHDAACYNTTVSNICGLEESAGHAHGDGCYETVTSQICSLTEHTHGDGCGTDPESDAWLCGMEEHGHADGCYTSESKLICQITPHDAHSHSDSCAQTTTELTCQKSTETAHEHTDACYAWESTLICGHDVTGTEPVPTETSEPILVCELAEICVHTHASSCYDEASALVCGLLQTQEHTHEEGCFTAADPEAEPELVCELEEHTHDEVLCYIDLTADVETAADWENTIPKNLAGKWNEDLLAVAESQLGYTESTYNVQVDADGRIWGYTRYGAWYGDPYGHWSAMFVSFCLNYAQIDQVPFESNAHRWVQELEKLEMYASAADYVPIPGDLVFLSDDGDETADRVAIVSQVSETELETIQGDTENRTVDYVTYEWSSLEILGYGILPETPEGSETTDPTVATEPEAEYFCGQEEHVHAENCYDADGSLTCGLMEHSHTEECTVEPEEVTYYCGLEAHTHGETCTDEEGNLICELTEHAHTEECLVEPVTYYCGLAEHTHEEVCYDAEGNLICESIEHTHTEGCTVEPEEVVYYCGLDAHTHGETCTDEEGNLICELTEHSHSEECTIEPPTYYCGLEEHTHDEACYDAEGNLICEHTEHTHTEECAIEPPTYYCGFEEHTHGDTCFDAEGNLICELTEHTHSEACTIQYYCGLEEHTHAEGCYDAEGLLICEIPEHTHTEQCTVEPLTYYCGFEEHTHGEDCYDEEGNLVCELEEHTHTEECLVEPVYYCGLEEHTHEDVCYDAEGNLICGREEHTHTDLCGYDLSILDELSEDDRERVMRVIRLIDEMPSADEIDAKKAEFEAAEDYEGEEAWLTEIYQQISDGYIAYSELGIHLQSYVVNADKLMELEYIWSAHALIEDITSAAPTPTWYTSTKDFIELNLYDYVYGINGNWENDKNYPGFQWNGGAYSKSDYRYTSSTYANADDGIPNALTDRYYIDSIDFGNSIITNYAYQGSDYAKSTTSTAVGKLYNNSGASSTGKINWLWYDGSDYASTTNRPVGFSTGYQSISRTLGSDGYPSLMNGTSLAYLFGGSSVSYVIKQNSSSIDGLFQQDPVSGEYEYNSRINHAQYSNNFFQLYDDIITPNFITYPFGNFLPLNTITDSSQATQVGAFNENGGMKKYVEGTLQDLQDALDRDDGGNGTTADYGDTSRTQLKVMLQEYRENWKWYPTNSYGTIGWDNLSPAMAIQDYFNGTSGGDTPSADVSFVTAEHLNRMYNIDWDVATNFFFGMEMKMHFMQPKDGYTGNDTNGDGTSDYPMIFYFTGDDDVWVYIDGALFLDLSGIHRHVGGEIDFVNGKVHYYALSPATGDVSTTPYKTYTFAELLTAAGKDSSVLNSNGTFADYSTHDFNFYYMERGSGSSVCRLNFNFPLLKKNSISVNKENLAVDGSDNATGDTVLGNPDYYFNIVNSSNNLFVGPNSVTGISNYKIMDSSGNILKNADGTDQVFTTDQYGIFTLKAGQTAVFEGIEENEGKYFVQELIKAEDNDQYPNVYVNDKSTRYNELIDWSCRTYFSDSDSDKYTGPYGYKWYGRSGEDTDSSSNASFYFKQQNHVNVDLLGTLSLTKKVERYTAPLAETYYRMYVLLDDEKLPDGMKVTVTSADGTTTREATVGSDGNGSYIEIAEGETALIPNIISGTKFTIWESGESSEGYKVEYSQTGADEVVKDGSFISGIVRVNADVVVTITNAENGTQIEIPGIKSFQNFSGGPYQYSFTLTETDSTGTSVDGGITLTETVDVVADNTKFRFAPITYLKHSFETLPAMLYYVIEETGETDHGLDNTQKFLVEVTVSQNEADDGISAAVTKVSEYNGTEWTAVDGTVFNFVNTITGDLSLSKTVEGVNSGQEFGFIIKLEAGDSGVDPLPTSYPATAYNADGTTPELLLPFGDDYETHILMTHGERLVIHGIPIGVKWTIIEGTVVREGDSFTVTETPPAGYITSVTTGTVTGESGEITGGTTADGTTSTGSIVTGETEVVYTNTSTYALPETGGTGTIPYTMAGLMLMLFSAAFLLYKTKKCRREVN